MARSPTFCRAPLSCQIGHEATPEKDPGNWTKADLPTWPYEVTYNASGYGTNVDPPPQNPPKKNIRGG